MASPFTVDASVFLNGLLSIEPGHVESKALFEIFRRDGIPLIAPTILLPETAATLSRVKGDPKWGIQFAASLRRLPGLVLVNVDRKLARQSSEVAARYRLRGSDAIYVATAIRFNSALVTMDKEQHDRAAGVIRTCYPLEILQELS